VVEETIEAVITDPDLEIEMETEEEEETLRLELSEKEDALAAEKEDILR
jgi:hypothetical protein